MPVRKKKHLRSLKKTSRDPRKRANKGFWLSVLKFCTVVSIWLTFFASVLVVYYAIDLPDISGISKQNYEPQITIRSADGIVLAKYGDIRGKPLMYSQIPTHLIDAVISTEDRRFFDHWGVDIFGIIRANFSNIMAGRLVQGGSTITQQLAKIVFFSPKRTLKRKIQEVLMAVQLEYRFSKEQIMSIYANRVYMGKGVYGIDAAARYYFGKYAEHLNLFESAMLAGMLKAPSRYNPANNPILSVKRARQVLLNMENAGFISIHEVKSAIPPKIIQRGKARGILKEPYFSDYVLEQLPYLIGKQEIDLNIYTTINMKAQRAMEQAIAHNMKGAQETFNASQAAGIAMQPNGAIKAIMGGVSYRNSQFNRAIHAKRQTGSAFKLFVYLAGLENGYGLYSRFDDKPISLKIAGGRWRPQNYTKRFYGNISLKTAFKRSINTVTVQLSEKVGRHKVIEMTRRLGIDSPMLPVPSIALGVTEVSLINLTKAYAHIANDGHDVHPFVITKITDTDNNILYEHRIPAPNKVLKTAIVQDAKSMLQAAVEEGSGIRARLKTKAYGKTGTSQNHRDAWFIGFREDGLVAGIWVGNDDEQHMKRVTGSTIPARIWKSFMSDFKDYKPIQYRYSKKRKNIIQRITRKKYNSIDEIIEKNYQ